ncbi:MAG: hypothetical protein M3N21_04800 [Actinomycetota bacterium]|nr:hypothetical protein [Actinomycetota bacterium]
MLPDPRRLVVAAAVAASGGLLAAGAGVPLYDGVGFPDEPYRYVSPPPGYPQTPPATSGVGSLPIRAGQVADDLVVATDEQGSQASLYVPGGSLVVPAGATGGTVRVVVTPRAADPPPPDGMADGNAYDVDVSSTAGDVRLSPTAVARITLRDALRGREPVMEFHAAGGGSSWVRLATDRVGADIYAAPLAQQGRYLLVLPGAAAPRAKGSASGQVPLVIGAAALVAILVLVGVRFTRGSSAGTG